MNINGLEFISLRNFFRNLKTYHVDFAEQRFSTSYMVAYPDHLYPNDGTNIEVMHRSSAIDTKKLVQPIAPIDIFNIRGLADIRKLSYKIAYNALKASIPHEMTKTGTNLLSGSIEAIQEAVMRCRQHEGVDVEDLIAVRIAPRTYAIANKEKYLLAISDLKLMQIEETYDVIATLKAAFFKTSNDLISVVKLRKGL